MNIDRIKEIQSKTAYPNSTSVQQALLQVWNECAQEKERIKSDNEALKEIVKAVAHIRLDWGYGKFELNQEHIDKARELMEEQDQ